jgi:ABC-type nitrate/sulfonate/bicarbonate transport system substrate-binding protein
VSSSGRATLFLPLAAAGILLSNPGRAATPVKVLIPDSDNLQYVAFWTAKGAGYFEAEGVSVDLVIPEVPAQAIARMIAGEAPVAVLPPPVYLQLVADRFPLQLVANLLQNDPIDLIVRRSIFEERKMSATAPLRDRLVSLKGLRVGVAPGPPARLRALFSSVGLDADRDVKIVIRRGQDQNQAFADDDCDALYAHTPFLEKAIDDQDAVILVNQSAGEVPQLATRQIHALVARDDFLGPQRPTVAALVRAIARAESLVHTDLAATEDAVMRAIPWMDRRHLHTLLALYQSAVPLVPRVSVDGLAPALALFPASRTAPSLEGVPLADFVAPDLLVAPGSGAQPSSAPAAATRARSAWSSRPRLAMVFALLALIGIVSWLRRGRARQPS